MLSNPPLSNLHPRHRQHRRQNSTPTAFEAVKIPNLPNIQRRQPVSHRRGLSLDTRQHQIRQLQQHQQRQQQHSTTIDNRQDFATTTTTVSSSTTTNHPGLPTTPQHHVLREAQQQRIIARPGPSQAYANLASDGAFMVSPHPTPQHNQQQFDAAQCGLQTGPQFAGNGAAHISLLMRRNQAAFNANAQGAMTLNTDFDIFEPSPDSALSTPSFINYQDSPAFSQQGWASEGDASSSRRSSRRISNGIMDRVNKFETLGSVDGGSRPATPPTQNVTGMSCSHLTYRQTVSSMTDQTPGYFPPTPIETPCERMVKHQPRPTRFAEGYDESMEDTIKPRNRSKRASGVFQELRQQAEAMAASQQRANTMAMPLQSPDFMNLGNMSDEFVKIETGINTMHGSANGTPDLSHHSTPVTPYGSSFENGFHATNFDSQATMMMFHPNINLVPGNASASESCRESPHRRTDSLASIASAASISSLNIDETKTETGVTLDDISAHIEGPDPTDGKWTCVFEDCGKKFGRKENIKSHVQTHLNDRQYQCPTCRKCFVRQHDLKRHAKIHTGVKPYPCDCGNSFARHDALTRHRQRGMCIGAFDGIVRKVVKRGRPKKHRPEMDARLDKSARTRAKNKDSPNGSHSPSDASHSGYTDSSAPSSPSYHDDGFEDMLDDQPFQDLMENVPQSSGPQQQQQHNRTSSALSTAPMGLMANTAAMPTISPAAVTTAADMAGLVSIVADVSAPISSPAAMSDYSHASHLTGNGGNQTLLDPFNTSLDDSALGDDLGLPQQQPHAQQTAPQSPAKSVASHYTHNQPGTPPDLSASSSPPPSSAVTGADRFFPSQMMGGNGDAMGCAGTDMGVLGGGMCAPPTVAATATGVAGVSMAEDMDLYQALGAGGEDLVGGLDGLSGLGPYGALGGLVHGMPSKFDEEYGMFTNDDVSSYFGP
ncbi:hypothetical protein RB601_005398 [Gaeumannomyces tritici]